MKCISSFLNVAFHKFYLVHSWIPWPKLPSMIISFKKKKQDFYIYKIQFVFASKETSDGSGLIHEIVLKNCQSTETFNIEMGHHNVASM